MHAPLWKSSFLLSSVLILALTWSQNFAHAADCPVGVNVNSFQNFDSTEQQAIVDQLKRSGVGFVRTSLRPDDKNMNLAKTLQSEGIGLVLVPGFKFLPDTPVRPADPATHIRSAAPLSSIDVNASKTMFQTLFDKLDAYGVTLAGVELGNEINWVDFNGDFPMPGQGKAFSLNDLSSDPEAKRVAQGLLQYLNVLAALKDVRDHSKLNHHIPLISAGMATVSGGQWQQKLKLDGVSIPATYAFLRAHGLDQLVDGYGVHTYPPQVKQGDEVAAAQRQAFLDEKIFPPGNSKPYWVTEWGFPSKATSSADDQIRTQNVSEMRNYFLSLYRQGRLGGIFWYVWNEPDQDSIYRGDGIMNAGRLAIAPMPMH